MVTSDNLHILNGDSSWHLFQEAGITGDTLIWREILCEGPVIKEVASDEFWQLRKSFVTEEFGPGSANYMQLIDDFEKLRHFKNYDEIILWFEYDLFCQINMMAVLSWCYKQQVLDHCKVFMICVGKEPGYNRLVGLGQIPVHRYHELYEERTALTEPSLAYANQVWNAFVSKDARELEFALMPHPVFQYLNGAIKSHFMRFPNIQNNLSEIEAEIIHKINNRQAQNVDDVVRHLLQWQDYYGFGDLQYFRYLRIIKDLIEFEEPLRLSEKGVEALTGNFDRTKSAEMNYDLGGATVNDFRWNESEGQLEPA